MLRSEKNHFAFKGPGIMMLYLFFSGVLLTHLRRPVSRMTVTEQQLEGEFRYVNSRLITNAEEVAFYRGNQREKRTMLTAFTRLVTRLMLHSLFCLLAAISFSYKTNLGEPLAPVLGVQIYHGLR